MYERFTLNEMTVETLYQILTSKKYDLFFCCIIRNNVIYRYKIPKVTSLNDLQAMFEKNVFRRFESGITSGDINIFESDFLDCYITNIMKNKQLP
jgi:hypothetical protein